MAQAAQLPYAFAKQQRLLAEAGDGSAATLYHTAQTPLAALAEARRALARPLRYQQLDEAAFERALQRHYDGDAGQAHAVAESMDEADLNQLADALPQPEDLLESADEAPIIRLINAMLSEAIRDGASDIHIEPFEQRLSIRFRIDGVLREMLQPARALSPLLTSRIKVMAGLDIAEKRLPQDGRISLRLAGRPVDVRVSTLPSSHGERVVLRLLDRQSGLLQLDRLGLPPQAKADLESIIGQPHGVLLVTGPTGSGKTTTLYAILSQLNDQQRNIVTVEDPIEYDLDGISQTQVNGRIEMSFARGLRAILRQDPDIVMVGEIRDRETAEIAVQASLTGHLVLSTLHTNSALGAINRLRNMGVEPFLLGSSVSGLMAQRLVRLLCRACRQPYTPGLTEAEALGIQQPQLPPQLYRSAGCDQCRHTGYRGRAGLFEVIPMRDELRRLIHDGADETMLYAAVSGRCQTLAEATTQAVLDGRTSLEEALRVSRAEG